MRLLSRRYKYRAGFVFWPWKNRWPLFCRQGLPAASAKLDEMLAALAPSSAKSIAAPSSHLSGNAALPEHETSQEPQNLDACIDVSYMIQAMYGRFQGSCNDLKVAGYESFGALALAFDQLWIYRGLLEHRLKVSPLNLSSAMCL